MGKNAEPGAGAIYRFHDGALECLHRDITVSNAICFAPDGRTAYFSDTRTHRILRQELDAQVEGLRRLVDAGVAILAGGDFGHQWTHHGTYAAELQRYVELVGMSPVAAIHTATRNLGPAVGLDIGEVRAGALADLLVVDGDPTDDVAVLADPERRRLVLKGGAIAHVNPRLYP